MTCHTATCVIAYTARTSVLLRPRLKASPLRTEAFPESRVSCFDSSAAVGSCGRSKSAMNCRSVLSVCGPRNLAERVTERVVREAHNIGAVMFGCPERAERISGDANGVRKTAVLRPAAKLMHTRAGVACMTISGRNRSVSHRRPRPNGAPAKKRGKMNPPCRNDRR